RARARGERAARRTPHLAHGARVRRTALRRARFGRAPREGRARERLVLRFVERMLGLDGGARPGWRSASRRQALAEAALIRICHGDRDAAAHPRDTGGGPTSAPPRR